ncbi:hypothetical protein pipiens_016743 [Culex pipiens pipiens]|uniref:DUF295 domain-containing protein n=1 Tax=Culex pipiens pipiens TaxID=38569 RepID=A0ABD1CJY0_CULPP
MRPAGSSSIRGCSCSEQSCGTRATPCRQPIEDDRFALLFNGDLFMDRDGPPEDSDTRWLFRQIVATRCEAEELRSFLVLKGPFSLVLLDKVRRRVYFGRDCFGRNSLLVAVSGDGIVVSSVLGNKIQQKTVELPPNGIYYVDLAEDNLDFHIFPWNTKKEESESALKVTFEDPIELPWLHSVDIDNSFNYHDLLKGSNVDSDQVFNLLLNNPAVSNLCNDLIRLLEQSVRERIVNTPAFCRKCLPARDPSDRFVPEATPIDLLNVAFEKIIRPNGKKQPTAPPPIDWNVPVPERREDPLFGNSNDYAQTDPGTLSRSTYWEDRSVALVEIIHNEDSKLNYILDILKSSPVPWSQVIAPLAKYAHSDHPIAAKILIEQPQLRF